MKFSVKMLGIVSHENTKERIQYIDALRGFAMLMVVFVHIEIFGFFNFSHETVLMRFFSSIHMPVFFFVSGLCSYKSNAIYNISRVCNDILRLIIPAFVVGLVYTYFKIDKGIFFFISDSMKAGYWFTISLFEVLCIYYLLYHAAKGRDRFFDYSLILIAVLLYLLKLPFKIIPCAEIVANFLCLHQTCSYFPFFVLGILFNKYKEYIYNLSRNQYVTAIVFVFLLLSSYLLYSVLPDYLGEGIIIIILENIVEALVGLFGVISLYLTFSHFHAFFSETNIIGFYLIIIGKNTMPIYLLHYFFLPHLPMIGDYLVSFPNFLVELFIGLSLSLLLIVVCIILARFISLSTVIRMIVYGR